MKKHFPQYISGYNLSYYSNLSYVGDKTIWKTAKEHFKSQGKGTINLEICCAGCYTK